MPGAYLGYGNPVTVTDNLDARFNIVEQRSPSDLPKIGDDFSMIPLLALMGLSFAGLVWLSYRMLS